jgi:methionyl aminopeptidase
MNQAAARHGCQIIPDFAGHGIGKALHEAPAISPGGLPGMGARLIPGMVVTIEPVVVAGSAEVDVLNDGWTYVTADGSLAAQFEVMVYVHRDGFEVISYPRAWGPIADALTSS